MPPALPHPSGNAAGADHPLQSRNELSLHGLLGAWLCCRLGTRRLWPEKARTCRSCFFLRLRLLCLTVPSIAIFGHGPFSHSIEGFRPEPRRASQRSHSWALWRSAVPAPAASPAGTRSRNAFGAAYIERAYARLVYLGEALDHNPVTRRASLLAATSGGVKRFIDRLPARRDHYAGSRRWALTRNPGSYYCHCWGNRTICTKRTARNSRVS